MEADAESESALVVASITGVGPGSTAGPTRTATRPRGAMRLPLVYHRRVRNSLAARVVLALTVALMACDNDGDGDADGTSEPLVRRICDRLADCGSDFAQPGQTLLCEEIFTPELLDTCGPELADAWECTLGVAEGCWPGDVPECQVEWSAYQTCGEEDICDSLTACGESNLAALEECLTPIPDEENCDTEYDRALCYRDFTDGSAACAAQWKDCPSAPAASAFDCQYTAWDEMVTCVELIGNFCSFVALYACQDALEADLAACDP